MVAFVSGFFYFSDMLRGIITKSGICLIGLLFSITPLLFSESEVKSVRLDNGLILLMQEDHSVPLVSVNVLFHVGSKNEKAGYSGITRVCEKIMYEGTPLYPKGEFERIIQAGGGQTSSDIDLDFCEFYSKVPSKMLDTVLFLEADRLQNAGPTYERLLLARETVKKERLAFVENQIYGYLNEEILTFGYRAHPYQNPLYGRIFDLDNLTLEDVNRYFRQYFQPGNATISIVGDFGSERVLPAVSSLFGKIVASPPAERKKVVEPEQKGERREILETASQIPVVVIGYHVPSASDPDIPILNMITNIAYVGESSRLFKKMVIDNGSALVAGGGLFRTEDPGMIFFYAILNYGTPIADAENQLLGEINRFKDEPVTPRELEKAKNRIEVDYYIDTGPLEKRAMLIGYYYSIIGDLAKMKEEITIPQRVTAEDIMRVARKYFGRSNRTVITLQPGSEISGGMQP